MYNLNMFYLLSGIFFRIFSNSYLNFFQKLLTFRGERASVINFYTYFCLSIIGLFLIKSVNLSHEIVVITLIMGLLGALGNYCIIKALSLADLSSIAPINSYKPIVALIIGILYLNEIPSIFSLLGMLLIILGTYYLYSNKQKDSVKIPSKAVLYRVLALVFSGTEAIFIKKLILLTDITTSFSLWAISGFLFSYLFVIKSPLKINLKNIKLLFALVLSVCIMQLSTNYVFANMNVSYALALFQLSTIISIFLGVKVFNETSIKKKVTASLIMILGAVVIILF